MSRRLGHRALPLTLTLLAACSNGDASAPSTFAPGETSSDTSTPPLVDDLPAGACADEGSVRLVRVRGGCRGREGGAPDRDNDWRCTCTAGNWQCEIEHASFGATTCP